MSTHTGKEPPDRRLKYLIEMADECHVVAGGYRLRFTRSNTTLLLVMGAIEANPAHGFKVTIDETGACWVDVKMPLDTPPSSPRTKPAARPGGIPVVA